MTTRGRFMSRNKIDWLGTANKARRRIEREEAERAIERLEKSFAPFPPMDLDDNPTVPDGGDGHG